MSSKKNNIIENMGVQSIFVRETLNDKEDLINDYMFNCGMSYEEANYAAENCLKQDLE